MRKSDLKGSERNVDPLRHSQSSFFTCELFFTAVSNTFLQVLQLVFYLLVLSLRLLTLPPVRAQTSV